MIRNILIAIAKKLYYWVCKQKFIENIYSDFPYWAIIDKDYFSKKKWSNSFSNFSFDENHKAKECFNEFQHNDCIEIKFEKYSNLNVLSSHNKVKQLNIYYYVVYSTEDETSLYKLLIDILSVQSILFGQNVLKLLLIIYFLLNTKHQLRGSKYYLYFIYLICLSGFIFHTFFIFKQLFGKELIHYVYFTLESSMKIPEIVFCFNINQSIIDRNYKQTENYLNELTYNLRIDTIFRNITYLSKSNKWISFESNSDLKISSFYLLDKKCFKIELKLEYDRNRFYLFKNNNVLKIFFSKTFYDEPDKFSAYFLLK